MTKPVVNSKLYNMICDRVGPMSQHLNKASRNEAWNKECVKFAEEMEQEGLFSTAEAIRNFQKKAVANV